MKDLGNNGTGKQALGCLWLLFFVAMLVVDAVSLLFFVLSFSSLGEAALNWQPFSNSWMFKLGLGITFSVALSISIELGFRLKSGKGFWGEVWSLLKRRVETKREQKLCICICHDKRLRQLDKLHKFPNLQRLYIVDNTGSISLPSSIGQLSGLQELYIVDNTGSISLPSSIGQLSGLQELYIVGNTGSISLPSSIGQLSGLQELYIVGNTGSISLPSSIGQLSGLQELHIIGNPRLRSLPDKVGTLTGLRELHIVGNEALQALPESMGQLTGLRKLYLDCDLLLAHSQAIAGLVNLEELHVVYGEREKLADFSTILPNTNVSDESYQEYETSLQKRYGGLCN